MLRVNTPTPNRRLFRSSNATSCGNERKCIMCTKKFNESEEEIKYYAAHAAAAVSLQRGCTHQVCGNLRLCRHSTVVCDECRVVCAGMARGGW